MKRAAKIASLIICLHLAATNGRAQESAARLIAIEHERLRSLVDADMPTARRLHSDDFQLINPDGGTMSKELYLGRVADGSLDYIQWEPEEIRVKLYGSSAVIRYKAHLKVSINGSAGRDVYFWHTDLYEKQNGQWQIVWAHATMVKE
jgi:hypothetical protein